MKNDCTECVLAVCVLVLGFGVSGAAEPAHQPNVIFVLADDLGWSELGCYGNRFNETPHLDALAKRGMRFTQAYAAAPVCSPYRAALLTGQLPARTGIMDYLRPNSANALSTDHITLAEMFQQNGYATGMIGKWHLTGYRHHDAEHEVRPTDHGFDWNFASEVKGVGNGANFWPYVFRDQSIRWIDIPANRLGESEYLTDRLNVEAVDFIDRHKDRPFFLYLSHYAPHTILHGRPDLVDKYRKKHRPGASTRTRCHLCQDQGHDADALNHWAGDHNPHLAAMLESIDDGMGRITSREGIDARIPSPPLLASTRQLYFADHFSAGQVSDRWFFTKDWSAEGGVLGRGAAGSGTTRIFLRDAQYEDVVIRFDFQLRKAKDVRLVTGSSGHYNAVIHIRPDHFYVQTAKDDSGPYFSYRHGECAYDFAPDRWYTMTVEFIGDQLVAHLDRDHLAYAKHPILDKQRTYFALQVDQSPAAFDNLQILRATKHPDWDANLKQIAEVSGKYPVDKTLAERFDIQRRNAHEWFYQRQQAYRALVKRVDELDALKTEKFPEVFRSHKEFRKQLSQRRKKLHAEDPVYKETLFATYRAQRAITAWLIQQAPEVGELPSSRRPKEIDRLRVQHRSAPEYLKLVAAYQAAQRKLEADYAELFMSDEEINEYRKEQRAKVEKTPEFKEILNLRAVAYRAQQDYLLEHDAKLSELQKLLKGEEEGPRR